MNKNDYYHMAVKSGLWQSTPISDESLDAIHLMEFVRMVVREERHECSKECDRIQEIYGSESDDHSQGILSGAVHCSAAIRARFYEEWIQQVEAIQNAELT